MDRIGKQAADDVATQNRKGVSGALPALHRANGGVQVAGGRQRPETVLRPCQKITIEGQVAAIRPGQRAKNVGNDPDPRCNMPVPVIGENAINEAGQQRLLDRRQQAGLVHVAHSATQV